MYGIPFFFAKRDAKVFLEDLNPLIFRLQLSVDHRIFTNPFLEVSLENMHLTHNLITAFVQEHLETNRYMGKPRIFASAGPVIHDFEVGFKEFGLGETVARRPILISVALLIDPELLVRGGTWDGRVDDSGPLIGLYIQSAFLIVFERDGEGRTTAPESDINVIV